MASITTQGVVEAIQRNPHEWRAKLIRPPAIVTELVCAHA